MPPKASGKAAKKAGEDRLYRPQRVYLTLRYRWVSQTPLVARRLVFQPYRRQPTCGPPSG
ncbi:hypothetical protein E2C01_011584 [Portunus trituberculatus]|uniref:Uncharacterized protein n=1 Tax=Portunus trituberculatus TaxID=210409 RepID=A0A5B7DBS4_PORTR|nr:hypothetical protein [Portunus trituberculatus]